MEKCLFLLTLLLGVLTAIDILAGKKNHLPDDTRNEDSAVEIRTEKSAYKNGKKITGTMIWKG